jgi:polyphosphate kinase 2 (PPK2 family)
MKRVGGSVTRELFEVESFSGKAPTVHEQSDWCLWKAPEEGAGRFHLVGESWDVWYCRQMVSRVTGVLRDTCQRLILHGGGLTAEERVKLANAEAKNGALS